MSRLLTRRPCSFDAGVLTSKARLCWSRAAGCCRSIISEDTGSCPSSGISVGTLRCSASGIVRTSSAAGRQPAAPCSDTLTSVNCGGVALAPWSGDGSSKSGVAPIRSNLWGLDRLRGGKAGRNVDRSRVGEYVCARNNAALPSSYRKTLSPIRNPLTGLPDPRSGTEAKPNSMIVTAPTNPSDARSKITPTVTAAFLFGPVTADFALYCELSDSTR
jgi:hypothetical protein